MQFSRLAAPILRHSGCRLAEMITWNVSAQILPMHVSIYTYFWFPEYGCGFIPRRPVNQRHNHPAVGHDLSIYANMILLRTLAGWFCNGTVSQTVETFPQILLVWSEPQTSSCRRVLARRLRHWFLGGCYLCRHCLTLLECQARGCLNPSWSQRWL